MVMFTSSSGVLQGALFLLFVSGCNSWSISTAALHQGGNPALLLRNSNTRAPAAPLQISAQSLEVQETRRDVLKGFGALALPLIVGAVSPLPAGAAIDSEVEKKLTAIPLSVLGSIAGGSADEFAGMKATFTPAKSLEGLELSLYQIYRYAAVKAPAMDDPRQSLRGLFISKSGDALEQWIVESGQKLKTYDARGDGLTNQGKGGAVKGTKLILEFLKSKGVIGDFALDTSKHNELSWSQANPSLLSVSVKAPIGAAAAKQLEEEKVGVPLSIVAQAISGYLKQCKVAVTPSTAYTADGETITLNLAWAGKARQLGTMERRNNDKLNAARGYKE